VKRAKADLAQAPVRAMGRSEERFITNEDVEAERARREEAETDAMLADFERRHGDVYEALSASADAAIPARIGSIYRAPMIRGALVRAVREWVRDNEGGQRAAS
jgi:hypothetical protein